MANVAPYLDGYKVTLEIGNLTGGEVVRGSISLEFNRTEPAVPADLTDEKVHDEWRRAIADWTAHSRQVNVEILQPLESGAWTDIDVIVPSAKPNDLDFIRVMVSPTQIGLRRASDKTSQLER